MEYRELGNTGIQVSRLCFGSLTIGPLQAHLPLREGVEVIRSAFAAGVNFIDTAELYETYDYIREIIAKVDRQAVIASKSYAYTYEGMKESVERACFEIGRDYIDLFLMHEQTSRLTLKGHRDALEYLIAAKQAGKIRAIGVSTHTVEVVRAVAMYEEVDVVHPIFNMQGIGIQDGTVEDMRQAIDFAVAAGKGVYSMKALGGGHLIPSATEAVQWVLKQPGIDAIAVGMQSIAEVACNTLLFSDEKVPVDVMHQLSRVTRKLVIEEWCIGCGKCAKRCTMGAIRIIENKAVPQAEKCVTCGYCGAVCPEFCIKII